MDILILIIILFLIFFVGLPILFTIFYIWMEKIIRPAFNWIMDKVGL
jgi:hypothetical protein